MKRVRDGTITLDFFYDGQNLVVVRRTDHLIFQDFWANPILNDVTVGEHDLSNFVLYNWRVWSLVLCRDMSWLLTASWSAVVSQTSNEHSLQLVRPIDLATISFCARFNAKLRQVCRKLRGQLSPAVRSEDFVQLSTVVHVDTFAT